MIQKRQVCPIILLALSIGIYGINYLINVFYVPFQEAFSLDNTQVGTLLAVNSAVSIGCHLIGGKLCDVISPKICICGSVIISGLLAVWMSTMPGYQTLLLIYGLLSVINLVWAPYVKCTQMIGTQQETGRIFGLTTMIDGVIATVMFSLPVVIVGSDLGDRENLSHVILFFGVFYIVAGIIIAIFFDYGKLEKEEEFSRQAAEPKSGGSLRTVLKMPQTWIVGVINLCYYTTITEASYISPYLIHGFSFPVALSTICIIFNRFVIRAAASPVGGLLRDRLGTTGRSIRLTSVVTIAGFVALSVLPAGETYIIWAILTAVIVFFSYSLNSNAANTALREFQPPAHLAGTIVGAASTINGISLTVITFVSGAILDRYPVRGYRLVFLIGALAQGAWFLCGTWLEKKGKA